MGENKFERIDAIKDRAICLVESQINGDVQNVDAEELGEIADIIKDMAETKKLCMEAKYYETVIDAMEEADPMDKQMYMDKYIPEQRMFYGGKYPYIPPYPIMYYGDRGGNYARRRDSRGRYMYGGEKMWPPMNTEYDYDDWDYTNGRMYYDDWNDGKMPMYQREYRSEPNYYGGRSGNNSGGTGNISSNGNMNTNSSNYYGGDMWRDPREWRDPKEGNAGRHRRMYMEMKEKGEDEESKHEELEHFMRELGSDMSEMLENASPQDKQTVKTKLTQLIGKLS